MPSIVAYERVLKRAEELGLRCVYHNGGAFVFVDDRRAQSLGWIGSADDTIRPEMRQHVRQVNPPYEANLARLLVRAWQSLSPATPAWVMPVSHWAYELQFGNREWMPAAIAELGIDPQMLIARNQADAIEFSTEEAAPLERFIVQLLNRLRGSDFAAMFPAHSVLARVHHHQQIWWTTTSPELLEALQRCT